jgi:uncharacterized repeat protein (TIGR01451 family)
MTLLNNLTHPPTATGSMADQPDRQPIPGPSARHEGARACTGDAARFRSFMSWIGVALFAFLLLGAAPVKAQDCSDYPGGVIDGATGIEAPAQLQIDRNCTIRNFPASNPLRTNFSFLTQPGQRDDRWLVVFDNVVHTGQMACNAVAGHRIWFVNGSSTTIQEGCQNLLIPVEKIIKRNPAGQNTATIGVPFTYTLTMPILYDAGTGTVINNAGSPNDLHGVTVTDDLNATGADLTYLSHVAYWQDDGTPVPHTFTEIGGVLTFDDFPIIPAGRQIIVEVTVVLDDTPANAPGTQFVNTAKWDFGRLIDGVFYEPLPGEWGVTEPMTIAAPDLVVTKSGPATINLGEAVDYTLDIQNIGNLDAWSTTIVDRLPNGADGGMCDAAPLVVSAGVFDSNGAPVPGKGALTEGTDYSLRYNPAPRCEWNLTTITAAAAIGPGEHLVITYQPQLDEDSQNGITLTNVAGATQWFSSDPSNADRQIYERTITDGTVGTLDHQDAHTVTVALTGFFFEKSVENLTSGVSPAGSAAPGDILRYTLRIRTTDTPLSDVTIFDDLGALNAAPVFASGTLQLVAGTIPAGADSSNTDPNGGVNGAGVLDVRNLDVPVDSELLIQFDITLEPVLDDGLVVTNQAELIGDAKLADSDDPNINGRADPDIDGDEDPTQIVIESAPAFTIEKISTYLSGDPDVLLAGETLRYTITVQNVGTADAAGVEIVDQIPADTTYVPGSTTLNGVALADTPAGSSPLADGMPVNAPGDATPGVMNAAVADNVATITFDVVVDPDAADGTIISNQAFLSALDHAIVEQPSDDPRTEIADDPTRDVVGRLPLLFAAKSADLEVDAGSPGIVDPGDVLRYTITIFNNGSVAATTVELIDKVPADTTYVADTMTLNGEAVGRPDGGVFPLAAGIPISSSDLTPPLPGADEGVLSPGESATVQFDLRVNDGVPTGTLITNQATVTSNELANLLTDGDGNPATGPEPTVVAVGDAQQLAIIKEVAVVDGGPAIAGATLEYTVTVRNVGALPALYVVITDDLSMPNPGYLTYVDQSAMMNGSPIGVDFAGTTLTADYSSVYGPLEPDQDLVLRFRAQINPDLADGTPITNTARVSWSDPLQWAEASVTIDVGGMPSSGMLSGTVWHDSDFDDTPDAGERLLEGWTVTLFRDDQPIRARLTDADGNYVINGVPPNYLSEQTYSLVFSAPGAGPRTARLGQASSEFTNGLQRIEEIVVQDGSNLQDLNLPIDPNGVVYDSVTRSPIANVAITLVDAVSGAEVPSACFDDPAQQGQVTLADGYYKFDINFSDPACQSGGDYAIRVVAPDDTYAGNVSELIPPTSNETTAPFDVPACPGSANDAIIATAAHCEIQLSEFAPPSAIPAQSPETVYHAHLKLDDSGLPGSGQIFNNHIPLDPRLGGAVSITKTTPMLDVRRGQMVPYVITVNNTFGADLPDVSIVDRFPPGFRYVEDSARFDDVPAEPVVNGRELVWSNLTLSMDGRHQIKLLLAVGAGVSEGEFTNRAQAVSSSTGAALSPEASATVRLVPDPTFDCTDVTGKVFDDRNRNGYQDNGETGLSGVRVVTARGLAAKTDSHGRYHITCAVTPHESRGSNFVLKLDDRTLPSGFRPSTRPVQVQRATRGKALRINFGASIHRVVGLDIADAVFEPGTVEMREQWRPRINLLLEELQKAPAVLRLSYLADIEEERLVERRLDKLKNDIGAAWEKLDCCYELVIEPEIFWRLGGPPDKPKAERR